MAKPTPTIETVPLSQLAIDPENARLHPEANLEAIKGSLGLFGQVEPLVVQAGTHRVIGGNGRLAAMRSLGWQEGQVAYVECTNAEATALGLALNRTAETAAWDTETLAALLDRCREEAIAVETFGFDEHAVDKIIARAARDAIAELSGADPEVEQVPAKEAPDDDPGDLPKESKVKLGDIWVLGEHRLACGDSSDHNAVCGLMGGAVADLVFTDPPYNLAGESTMRSASIRKNAAALRDADWDKGFDFADVEQNILSVMGENCALYVCTSSFIFGDIVKWASTWASYTSYCIWHKPNPMPSLMKRHWTHCTEIIVYATRGKHTFNFPDEGHALAVWSMSKSVKNDLHPTMKPIAVPAHAIRHSSKPGDIVVDLFGGAGSTLLACEQLGRVCYMMERDMYHCQTIINRWEQQTGLKANLFDAEGDEGDR